MQPVLGLVEDARLRGRRSPRRATSSPRCAGRQCRKIAGQHMAFNGSTHYAPGTLVEFFQRMGMSFGGDTNASHRFRPHASTCSSCPTPTTPTLAEGLASSATTPAACCSTRDEIDKERGIILSEKRARDSVGFRTFVAQFDFMLGDHAASRSACPSASTEVISKAPRERFVEFWDTWYRPERMAVDRRRRHRCRRRREADRAATFAPLKPRAPRAAGARRSANSTDLRRRARRSSTPSRRRPRPTSRITSHHALRPRARHRRQPREAPPARLALAMLNRRFSDPREEGRTRRSSSAGASVSEQFRFSARGLDRPQLQARPVGRPRSPSANRNCAARSSTASSRPS